jgi:ferredoxin
MKIYMKAAKHAFLCPDVFEMVDGKAHIKNPSALDTCNIQEAVDSCPAGALKWGD